MPAWLQRFIAFLKRLFGNGTPSGEAHPAISPPTKPALPGVPQSNVRPALKLETDEPPDYRKNKSLLTFQERKFYYTVLLKEIGGPYKIFAKVRLGDLIWIANEPKDRKTHNNQLQCKHIDFVVCQANTLEPLLAIELDDSSHSQYDRQESDLLKDRVCDEADLPLLRVKVEGDYAVAEIGAELRKRLDSIKNTN